MTINLTITMDDIPENFAKLREVLDEPSVIIDGGCGLYFDGNMIIHLLVEDARDVRRALDEVGLEISGCRPVLVLGIKGLPGRMGEIVEGLANSDIDIEFFYLNAKNQLVIGAGEVSKSIYAVLDSIINAK